jgi:uncharacterized protein (TIGR02145 family)
MTAAVTERTYTSAISGGNISSDGGSLVTGRGVCWSTIPSPTIEGDHTIDGTGIGSFSSSMKCLSFASTYYVRAYATNSVGTAYGDELSFTTPGTNPIVFNPDLFYDSVSDIDGNCYKTIKIGTQTWMAENLNVTQCRDGTSSEAIWYNDDPSTYKDSYGALYTWDAVQLDKICPEGWHVPSNSEWTILTTFLGGESVAGGKLKETGTAHWTNPNTDSNNESGFTSLPGGVFADFPSGERGFKDIGNYGNWWSRTPKTTGIIPYYACSQRLAYDKSNFYGSYEFGSSGLSIRCIKDIGHDINDNRSTITHKGICWNWVGNPEISDLHTDEGSGSENFKSTITFRLQYAWPRGLHIRAYATNGDGTGYGNEIVLHNTPLQ